MLAKAAAERARKDVEKRGLFRFLPTFGAPPANAPKPEAKKP